MEFNHNLAKEVLDRNGITSTYLCTTDGCIQTDTEEWMYVINDITGKDPCRDDLDEEDYNTISNFAQVLDRMNIQLF